MKYWLITDTHFNHKKQMMEYCGRPEDYETQLYESMEAIPKEDVLIHLGDICIGNDESVHKQLQALSCQRYLIRGNHDQKSDKWYLEHGWDAVADAMILRISGVHTLFTHIPHPDIGYGINIHGHFHNSDHRRHEPELEAIRNPRQHLIAVEYTGYKAIPAETFIKQIINSKA